MTLTAVESDETPRTRTDPDPEFAPPPSPAQSRSQALPEGTRLRDYELRGVLGIGRFGIVYVAWDHVLQRRISIKEYLPAVLATRTPGKPVLVPTDGAAAGAFELGLKAFVAEARMLARFDHPALLKVYRFWEENGTAYMAMPLLEGPTLEEALVALGRPQRESEIRAWLRPVLDAVSLMHAARCYHHHIGPDAIRLTPSGPVLLDLAAARRHVEGLARGRAAVAKSGYAPIEQYSDAATVAPGPWSDLYALAAVAYRAATGAAPPPAPDRVADDRFRPLADRLDGCSAGFAQAIDAALAPQPEHRPRHDAEFRAAMGGIEAPLPAITEPGAFDALAKPFLSSTTYPRDVPAPIPTQPYPAPVRHHPRPPEPTLIDEAPTADEAGEATPGDELGLGRRAMLMLAGGTVLLASLAGAALYRYAQAPLDAPPPAAAAPAADRPTAAAPAPITAPMIVAPAAAPILPAAPANAPPPMAHAAPPTIDARDQQTRCAELLQEAGLRRLTNAESLFYKKECR